MVAGTHGANGFKPHCHARWNSTKADGSMYKYSGPCHFYMDAPGFTFDFAMPYEVTYNLDLDIDEQTLMPANCGGTDMGNKYSNP